MPLSESSERELREAVDDLLLSVQLSSRADRTVRIVADAIRPLLESRDAEIERLRADSRRMRECAKCELTGGEGCTGLVCDECRWELEAEVERLLALVKRLAASGFDISDDAVYLRISDSAVESTVELTPSVFVDMGDDANIIGIEVLLTEADRAASTTVGG